MSRELGGLWAAGLTLGILLGLGGCREEGGSAARDAAGATTISVLVSHPVPMRIRDSATFTGRTDAVESVDVRARVTGYLDSTHFQEGAEVEKGQLLFVIDPRPYEATLATDEAQIGVAAANLKLAEADYARAKEVAKTPGAISAQEVDKYAAQVDVCRAQLDQAKANAEYAKLNVEFCSVRSPIAGTVSRYLVTPGNLINQDETLLTTIVSDNPIYGYFDVDENTLLRIQELIKAGKIKPAGPGGDIPVDMGLGNETGYPMHGTMNFINNQLDPTTGTLQVRGRFENPMVHGRRLLLPGMFIRTRVSIGPEYDAVLINERAVGSDLGLKYVYVVNAEDKIEYRKVTLGEEHDGLRVVSEGLKAEDRVLLSGLQRVKPGQKVQPRMIEMPTGTSDPFQATLDPALEKEGKSP